MQDKINGIMITGATGVLGRALIEECIERKINVLVLSRRTSEKLANIPSDPLVHVCFCELEQLDTWEDEDSGIKYDIFYHLAWAGTTGESRNDMYLQNKNVEYTLKAVHLAKKMGCSTFVGAGSQAEYGRAGERLNDKTPVNPENGYGMAKLCAGLMSRAECTKLGLRHIWARILSVYGPYDGENTMIVSAIRSLLMHKEPQLTAGEQVWDYIYSRDAARALLLLGTRGEDGKTYCIGSGRERPLKEYLYLLHRAVGNQTPLGIGKRPYDKSQVMYLCADIRALKEDTGFVPEADFPEGIEATVQWVKEKYGFCE